MPDSVHDACIRHRNGSEHEGHLGPAFAAMLHRIDQREADQARRGIRDWLLAPSLDLYHALQRGEKVPIELLNADAVRAYGIRR